MIHDADHDGVSNAQLVKEKSPLSVKYNGKSVAEQNSLELCWELLMQPKYEALRACIYTNDEEMERFRQTLVCVVLSTDIMDQTLGQRRKERWNRAFAIGTGSQHSGNSGKDDQKDVNRKATIVLEHLVSDKGRVGGTLNGRST